MTDGNNVNMEQVETVKEGRAVINCDKKLKIFYNAPQEVNRDISIVGIQTFINREKKKDVTILEAMAASGIRSIRYALELDGIKKVVANDYSEHCITSINMNAKLNGVEKVVEASCSDANVLMRKEKGFVVDLDPYGSPVAFIDAALQGLEEGGLFIMTATDMAGLAGANAGEACFAKYGSMPLKIKACHEMALRILIHTVQSSANRYGKIVFPLLSLKIDFYVRIFFKVIKSPEKAKASCVNTGVVYHCTGCKSLNFQPMAARKNEKHYTFARGPPVSEMCSICGSVHHIGGPIWLGSIHDKEFVAQMEKTLEDKYPYLNTFNRIQGMISLVAEETDVPLFYDIAELCSVLKAPTPALVVLRSAILNLGYKVSLSHIASNTIKTNCPNEVLWDILRAWKLKNPDRPLKDGPGYNIMHKASGTSDISFDLHPEANPVSRESNLLRFQVNPKNWGPGVRNTFKGQQKAKDRRASHQGKRSHKKSNDERNESKGCINSNSPSQSPNLKTCRVEMPSNDTG